MGHDQPRQQLLPFDHTDHDLKELERLARIERLLDSTPKITTADNVPYFDYHEATEIARGGR